MMQTKLTWRIEQKFWLMTLDYMFWNAEKILRTTPYTISFWYTIVVDHNHKVDAITFLYEETNGYMYNRYFWGGNYKQSNSCTCMIQTSLVVRMQHILAGNFH